MRRAPRRLPHALDGDLADTMAGTGGPYSW